MSFKSFAQKNLPAHSCKIQEKFWTNKTVFFLKGDRNKLFTVDAMTDLFVRARENNLVYDKNDCIIFRS